MLVVFENEKDAGYNWCFNSSKPLYQIVTVPCIIFTEILHADYFTLHIGCFVSVCCWLSASITEVPLLCAVDVVVVLQVRQCDNVFPLRAWRCQRASWFTARWQCNYRQLRLLQSRVESYSVSPHPALQPHHNSSSASITFIGSTSIVLRYD